MPRGQIVCVCVCGGGGGGGLPLLYIFLCRQSLYGTMLSTQLFLVSRHLGYNYVCDLIEYKTDAMHMRVSVQITSLLTKKMGVGGGGGGGGRTWTILPSESVVGDK